LNNANPSMAFGQAIGLLNRALRPAAACYEAAITLRNSMYDRGLLKSYRVTAAGESTSGKLAVSLPVISIGNITAGGTGKTPLVIWVCRFLAERGLKVAILTRGYKSGGDVLSDEPAILARSCPRAAVVVEADRVAGGRAAVSRHGAQVMVMDDGFQHRRLARDLDIVTIDATRPFGNKRVLPAGLLRDPVSSLRRAHAAVITRSDQLPEYRVTKIENQLRQINPNMAICRSVHHPTQLGTLGNRLTSIEDVKAKNVFVFCGVGNPEAFVTTVQGLGCNIVGERFFDDHHRYTARDGAALREQARSVQAEMAITTEKDWNKAALLMPPSEVIFAYLAVELRFVSGQERLAQLIQNAVQGRIPREGMPNI